MNDEAETEPLSRNDRWRLIFERLSERGLRDLHEALRDALAEDDALPNGRKKYGVREHSDFREESDLIEDVLKARGCDFIPIEW